MNKHFIIYQTTNKINGRFYVGMHATTNIDDGYLGSGKRIKAEIKKYGRENFERKVLERLSSKEALVLREKEIVTEHLRADPLCLNLKNGGEGGGTFTDEARRKGICLSNQSLSKRAAVSKAVTESNKRRHAAGEITPPTFAGRKHSEETKQKMRDTLRRRREFNRAGGVWEPITSGR